MYTRLLINLALCKTVIMLFHKSHVARGIRYTSVHEIMYYYRINNIFGNGRNKISSDSRNFGLCALINHNAVWFCIFRF